MTAWIYLALAILFEIAGTTAMKFSEGFSRILPSVLMGVFYIASLSMLTLALKKIEIGIAYAVWSGLGTALIAVIGILFFRESLSVLKVLSLAMIIAGVVGLNLNGAKG